jgi:hypothetical protein
VVACKDVTLNCKKGEAIQIQMDVIHVSENCIRSLLVGLMTLFALEKIF